MVCLPLISLFVSLIFAADPQIPATAVAPFDLRASLSTITYSVSTEALRALVPEIFKLVEINGTSPLLVISAHYTSARSIVTGAYGAPYDELGFATVVEYQGQKGIYFLNLQLDSQEAVDIGVNRYGFPKYLATMEFSQASDQFMMAAMTVTNGKPSTNSFLLKKGSGLINRGIGLINKMIHSSGPMEATAQLLFPFNSSYFFLRGDGTVVTTQMRISMPDGAPPPRVMKVESADFPYLAENGIIPPGQQNKPIVAVSIDQAVLRVEDAQPLRKLPLDELLRCLRRKL